MLTGTDFYNYLKDVLRKGVRVSNNGYSFVKWMEWGKGFHVGGLVYQLKGDNTKNIPKKMIILAYDEYQKGIKIDQDWVQKNGQEHWCHKLVLNYLFKMLENDPLITSREI